MKPKYHTVIIYAAGACQVGVINTGLGCLALRRAPGNMINESGIMISGTRLAPQKVIDQSSVHFMNCNHCVNFYWQIELNQRVKTTKLITFQKRHQKINTNILDITVIFRLGKHAVLADFIYHSPKIMRKDNLK